MSVAPHPRFMADVTKQLAFPMSLALAKANCPQCPLLSDPFDTSTASEMWSEIIADTYPPRSGG